MKVTTAKSSQTMNNAIMIQVQCNPHVYNIPRIALSHALRKEPARPGTDLRRTCYALAMTTGGNGSTFAFFLLGVPAPLPFFGSPPVLDAAMSEGGGGGPGVAGGASPSIPPAPDGPGAGGFALLFFLAAPAAGVVLFTVPSGPILACDGLGASSGRTITDGS